MLVALALCIYVVADLMPTWSLMSDNSDVLFVGDIARDINAGGRLFDWRLSHVPYLFPDIFVARLLVYLGVGVTQVPSAFQALFPLLLLPLVFALAYLSRADAPATTAFAGFIYLLTYIGELHGDFIAVHFGLIGFHIGALVPVISALIFAALLIGADSASPIGVAGLFLSLFLGLISDSLVGAIVLPPLAAWMLLLWMRRPERRPQVAAAAATIVSAIAFSRVFSQLNPFPQDREFLAAMLAAMPGSTLRSIRQFFADLANYAATSRISATLLILTLASYAICLRHLLIRRSIDLSALLALTVVISTPMVVALDLILGMYVGIGSCRHWAPAVYLTIVTGPIILSVDRVRTLVPAVTLAVGLFVSAQFVLGMTGVRSRLPADNVFVGLVACMEQAALPAGWLYISDYWISRPVRLLSGGRFGIVPYGGTVFTNQSNLKWIRSAAPRYAIVGYDLKEQDLVDRYGAPRATFCDMKLGHGRPVKVLDYSDNEAFKTSFRNAAATAY